MSIIYLSPSNQTSTRFAVSHHNESSYATELSKCIGQYLSSCGCCVHFPEPKKNLYDRSAMAKDLGCELYIALHSGFSFNNSSTGAVCYFHPADSRSYLLANLITNALENLCPIKANITKSVRDGTSIYGRYSLIEIKKPYELDMTAVLVEVNFHDNPTTCRWLVDYKNGIAKSISHVVADSYINKT